MAIHLGPWEDVVGQLKGLSELDGCFELKIGPVLVAVPNELGEKLKDRLGQKVKILRTDSDFRVCLGENGGH